MNTEEKSKTYLIGEIGQNHNGSVDIAKLIIDLAARSVSDDLFDLKFKGLDAVKLTKRDLNQELADAQKYAPYDSPHSFGKTYQEHREYLELTDQEHYEVFQYAKSLRLDFVETLCAVGCLPMLELFQPDYLKVASRDLTNLPLLDALANTKIPMIISTGMAGKDELDQALETITKHHENVSILHCVSQYPTHPNNVNLKTISYLLHHYPKYRIGYSDHTIGISAPVAAVAMGAEIIEKHITIDRRMKGSDQAGSLGPDGVHRMVRDIRLTEMGLGKMDLFVADGLETSRKKLERSIASKSTIKQGQTIRDEDLHLLSPGDGFRWAQKNLVVGKVARRDIKANEIIYQSMIGEASV